MKKEIIKPFDLEKAKAGAKLRTKGGCPVEIFKWDARGEFPIRGIVIDEEEDKSTSWRLDGLWIYDPNTYDLVIVEEVEEPEFWSDTTGAKLEGFYISNASNILIQTNTVLCNTTRNTFASKKQAKSALAMARISQIMANDIKNFGGVVTDEEWENAEWKFIIYRDGCSISTTAIMSDYSFLAFHTEKQRDLFLEKYPQLIKAYLMI